MLWVAPKFFIYTECKLNTKVHIFIWGGLRGGRTATVSLDRFPLNFPRTRVQVVARDTWFHNPEKFTLRDRICRKTLFYGTLFVISLRVTGNVLRRLHFFRPLVDIPQMCLSWVTFAEGCTVFQLSTSESVLINNGDTWMGTQ